ncbi:MAG: hypothetical protein FJW35_16700, partial [Acidobacteria bacterium]|nr:hypothetical protein [Acidobacteriota bacterium]
MLTKPAPWRGDVRVLSNALDCGRKQFQMESVDDTSRPSIPARERRVEKPQASTPELREEGMKVRCKHVLSLCIALGILLAAQVFAQAPPLPTAHEQSNYAEYTTYEQMMQFLTDVRGTSQEMQLKLYGSTLQQRPIPYAVFSRPPITQPWEAQVSGRPIVVFAANVHGGEKTLRESLLIILRDLATPGTDTHRLLDHVVFVIVPSINPDGFEMLPRSTRGNARGIDMNRDYMKLEQPELADYVLQVLQTWHPHVVVDGHNGGAFPYNICYQGPSTASHDPKLTEVCDREIFPLIDKRMEEAGYRSWYYSGGDRERWRVGGFDPRIGRNYLGLIGSIGILFESPGGQPMEMATRSGIVAYRTVAEFVAANAEKVMKLTRDARSETIALGKSARGEVVVRMKYEPEDYPVSYLIGEGSAGGWDRPIVEVKNAQIVKKPVPTQTRPRPYAYLLETRSIESVNMLRRHH